MFFGIVTTPNRVLAVSRLPAAFQVELSSSHSSTEFSRSDPDHPASANVVSPPPLLIVARLNQSLGVAMSPPVEMVRVVMSRTNVLCRLMSPPATITWERGCLLEEAHISKVRDHLVIEFCATGSQWSACLECWPQG